ncbi:MAG: molybdopterin molybdotransferase MoeA [Chloroflexi bacterium]|nr:molybdopterin molybdotransferase MoeA [Chloroflexota bacterium]
MLEVKTLAQLNQIITDRFGHLRTQSESVRLKAALGRRLAEDVLANEYVPNFNRSTVDGYALISADVFGCSESIPAILSVVGQSQMGEHNPLKLQPGACAYVPTGGELPDGADAVVMLEHTEDYEDGTIGVIKATAPGVNLIFKGDDLKPGQVIYQQGKKLDVGDIGTLAVLGFIQIPVWQAPVVGLISTGDELVEPGEPLGMGQIRDVNDPMLTAALVKIGAQALSFGICKDEPAAIREKILAALQTCDGLMITGGTSVGFQDVIPDLVSELGTLLAHGVAAKPGKPTLVGAIQEKPVFGLPGNPVAAFFMFQVLVKPLIEAMMSGHTQDIRLKMPLARAVPSNHGREDLLPVKIEAGQANPMIGKSGLITTLAGTDGYIRIPREKEGLKKDEMVDVILF